MLTTKEQDHKDIYPKTKVVCDTVGDSFILVKNTLSVAPKKKIYIKWKVYNWKNSL